MDELVWNDRVRVGVDEIDDDHRKLLDLYHLFTRAVTLGEESRYIDALFEELICFTRWHMSHEERLMIKYDYHAFADHQYEHEQLLQSARWLQEKFKNENKVITTEDVQFLEDWLISHILTTDKRMGRYLCQLIQS